MKLVLCNTNWYLGCSIEKCEAIETVAFVVKRESRIEVDQLDFESALFRIEANLMRL